MMRKLDRSDLHTDACEAAIVWASLVPSSFTGQLTCSTRLHVPRRAMRRSLAFIRSVDNLAWAFRL